MKTQLAQDEGLQTAPNSGVPAGARKMATDPPVSEQQRKAMYAALSGHSTLGIPKSVAEKFVGKGHDADMSPEDWDGLYRGLQKFFQEEQQEPEHVEDDKTRGAGVALRDPAGRLLFVHRSGADENGTWAFPGGYAQQNESEEAAAIRELEEELGFILRQPLTVRMGDQAFDNFKYTTFIHDVDESFVPPKMNDEHFEYKWARPDAAPQPLHPGVAKMLEGYGKDTIPLNLKMPKAEASPGAKELMSKDDAPANPNVKETKAEVDYSPGKGTERCENCTFFKTPDGCERVIGAIQPEGWCKHFEIDSLGIAADEWAFDYAQTARKFDADNRLHLEVTNISKANVCPYLGKEIPNFTELGLDPDKIYHLLRDPEELRKAAPTFNNLQILEKHVAVNADNPQKDMVIGSTGTDASFEFPYLKNSLVIWTKDAINDVESGIKKQLSCAYRYRADMTPGSYQGTDYDGVMRSIVGNHVALVKEGRAGPDVVVGDSKESINNQEIEMKASLAMTVRGALIGFMAPKLAQDAKVDFSAALKDDTYDVDKVYGAVTKLLDGKLAKDARLDGLKELLKSLATDQPPPFEGKPEEAEDDEEDDEEEKKRKAAAADRKKARDAKRAKDAEEPPFEKHDPDKDPTQDADEEEDKKKEDDKAMDERIAAAVKAAHSKAIKDQLAIREAERAVRPWVGELNGAYDSAEQVYRTALDMIGVPGLNDVHASALPHILNVQPKPGERRVSANTTKLGMDSSASATEAFNKRYPGASRIQVIG